MSTSNEKVESIEDTLRLALEALKLHVTPYKWHESEHQAAIKSLEEALKQEQRSDSEKFGESVAWVGLTDEEIDDLNPFADGYEYRDFARDIEAKLKEKNGIAPQRSDK